MWETVERTGDGSSCWEFRWTSGRAAGAWIWGRAPSVMHASRMHSKSSDTTSPTSATLACPYRRSPSGPMDGVRGCPTFRPSARSARGPRRPRDVVAGDAFPVFLGGDHSVSIGTVSGMAAGRTGVLWVDAHADFNTPATSPSGNVHGMPLAALCGYGHPDLVNVGGEGPSVRPQDVVVVGLRRVDREERRFLIEAGAKAYTMKEIDAYGIASVVREALEDLSRLERVHLSFDLDAVDPEVAPGVGTPVRGGLSYREAHLAMEMIAEAQVIGSMEAVEVNPMLDHGNATGELVVELIASALGARIL